MKLKRKTPVGTIIAMRSTDPEYPGIWIDLFKNRAVPTTPLCTVEYSPKGNGLRVLVYGDGASEEPSDIISIRLPAFMNEQASKQQEIPF